VLRLLIVLCLFGAADWSQAEEKSSAVLSIEDLLIEPKQWTLSPRFGVGTDHIGDSSGASRSLNSSLALNYGLSRALVISWQYSGQRLAQNDTRFNASTQALGFRWRLPVEGAWQWSISAHREILASHSAAGLAWASPAHNLSIQAYRFLDPLVLSSSIAYYRGSRWRLGRDVSPRSQGMNWSVGLDFAVNRVVGLYTSYQLSHDLSGQSGTYAIWQRLNLGGSYRLSADSSLALTLGFGLADESAATLSVQGRYRF
jgi:hypothetical protein